MIFQEENEAKRVRELVEQAFLALQTAGKLAGFELPVIEADKPEDLKNGDYTSNIAMQVAKLAKQKPTEIASLLAQALSFLVDKALFSKVEAVDGYINFYLSNQRLLAELPKIMAEKDGYGQSQLEQAKTMVIDYSAPNIAKPFGIGHLRSTIIGQAIYNIYKSQGYKVIGDNHLGDWGTQFGKLIYQIELKVHPPAGGEKLKVEDLNIEKLEQLYVEFHQQAKENPQLEDEARGWFKKLEQGDKEAKAIWQACFDISIQEFNRIYDLLGVKIDQVLGESFYLDKMPAIFEEMKAKKIVELSEGAWVVKFPNEELPTLPVVKSDGATTYFLRDLATIQYRLNTWQPQLIIYEVGVDQSLHFRQLFKVVEMLGWTAFAKASASQGQKIQLVHVAHGLMRSKTGKFSTRKGETVHLEDVLREAIAKAREVIDTSETNQRLSEAEKQKLAQQVGIGAIKYNDLSQHYSRDIIFDWDKILNLKGNSGPYLQYTYARCQSVLQKSGLTSKDTAASPALVIARSKATKQLARRPSREGLQLNEEELTLLRHLIYFSELLQKAARSFSPNLICNYVFALAQEYNLFYAKHSILQADSEEQKKLRLALTAAVAQVIKNSLTLLGIEAPDRM